MARILFFALIALLAAGCGSEEAEFGGPTPDSARSGTAVAALGDSITAGNPLYDPDPAQREALGFGSDPQSQYEYWAAKVEADLDFTNCGVFGERTDEIAARLDECADGADLLIVQGGINDIAQALELGPAGLRDAVETAGANIDGMLARAERLEIDAAVANVLPWNNGHPEADAPIAELNARIAEIARAREVPLLDFHRALEDPDDKGVMAPLYTDDGDHPSIEGYRILGELVAQKLG